MTCNCNDNTPEFYITLDSVGLNGFSPTVDVINEDTSGFQLDIVDVNGEETTPIIPKLSHIENAFLEVDGSNANNPITLNTVEIKKLANNLGSVYCENGIQIASGIDKNIILYPNGTGILKYKDNEIATISDLPDVGNGTITVKQGGITKGTFTVNQSGNSTISLDAGSGVVNPITLNESGEGFNSSISIGIDTTDGSLKSSYIHENISSVNPWTITVNDLLRVNAPDTDSGMTTTTSNPFGIPTVLWKINTDNTSIGISDNKLYIKDTQDFNTVKLANGYSTGEGLYGWLQDGSNTVPLVRIDNLDAVVIGNTSSDLILQGDKTRPDYYNGTTKSLALYSDIPSSDNIEAHKAYKSTGELLTDTQGLADVKSYAHSTFDSTKFTVTGSPTITDDGVASGFSSSNYISTPAIDLVNKTFKLEFVVKTPSTFSEGVQYGLFSFRNANYGICRIYIDNARRFASDFVVNGSGVAYTAGSLQSVLPDTWYKIELEQTASQFSLKYTNLATGVTVAPSPASNSTLIDNTTYPNYAFRIGIDVYSSSQANWENGLIDLKQFSITVDGVPVFRGNKTGIDTIKPDDYTVVGSPTISADGIASGFSDTSYLTFTPYSYSNSLEIYFAITPDGNGKVDGIIGSFASSTYRGIQIDNNSLENKTFRLWLSSDGSSFDICSAKQGTATNFTAKVVNYFRLTWYGMTYKLQHSLDKVTWDDVVSQDSTAIVNTSYNWIIGGSTKSDKLYGYTINGTIDLNTVKIYTDGDLVYQPCLKIPYTLSKTGSKVVDSYYRPRVEDMYNQFGYAPYYTLNESNNNFTLPQTEIYGLINKVDIMPDYSAGISMGLTSPTSNTTNSFTAPSKGFIILSGYHLNVNGNAPNGLIVYLNNHIILEKPISIGSNIRTDFTLCIPVDKGDVINLYSIINHFTLDSQNFFPAKGGN